MLFALSPVFLNETAYNLLVDNVSVVKSSYLVYTTILGGWFWVIMLVFLAVATYLRTEDLSYVFMFGLLGLLGLSAYGLLPYSAKPIMFIILSVALLLTLYAFFVRRK
jgi:hypothetical protein